MSNALDNFERSLVSASRALQSHTAVTRLPSPSTRPNRRAGPVRRFRSLSLALRVTAAAASFSLITGAAFAAYTVLSNNNTKTLATFSCDITGEDMAVIPAVTGDPLIDCAAAWPSASGGKRSAPPLTLWGTTSGRETAVARPTALGPEPSSQNFTWKKLPDGWTVNLSVVEVTDQLNNITIPFNGNTPAEPCTRIGPDTSVVRSLLERDGLASWTVTARGQVHGGPVSKTACRAVIWIVNGASQNVLLLQGAPTVAPPRPVRPTKQQRAEARLLAASRARRRRLMSLYTTVNTELDQSCQSVQAAAKLWSTAALNAGFAPATLAYWRELNTNAPTTAKSYDRYTLFEQPSSQHTGKCAHILVTSGGDGGLPTIYAARVPA
jgi:hypothetical protein